MLLQRAFYRPAVISIRCASAVPKVGGESPPPIEDFDPLNPGKWQIGTGGKLVPRIPEGTRVGKLVMGKYGLYEPSARRDAIGFFDIWVHNGCPEEDFPRLRKFVPAAWFFCGLSLFVAIYNCACLIYGKMLWPYQDLKRRG